MPKGAPHSAALPWLTDRGTSSIHDQQSLSKCTCQCDCIQDGDDFDYQGFNTNTKVNGDI